MKKLNAIFIVISAIFAFQSVHAQIDFQEHNIDNTNCIDRIYPSDIDGDGDFDFFATCFSDNERHVTWYKNSDGLGNFIAQGNMSTDEEAPTRLYPCDIDGDGDMDVLSASQGLQGLEKKLFWYENTDGQGNFGDRQIIDVTSQTPWSINASDIDGDGDLDVIASIPSSNKIVWYENSNGLGDFDEEQIISDTAPLVWGIDVSDVDGDGDMDVLSASEEDNDIAWYENTNGLGNFGSKQVISTEVDVPVRVYTADLDDDGDQDVISSSFFDGKIAWYENIDGLGSFSDQNIILINETGVQDLAINDLDGDGDLDVLSTSRLNTTTKVAWYENIDGFGGFGDQQILTNEMSLPKSIHAVDIDGDLDMDVIFNSGFSGQNISTSYWYENLSTVSIQEYTLSNFSINPTIVKDYLIVESETEIVSIDIYNSLGQLILYEAGPNIIDVSTQQFSLWAKVA